MENWLYFVLNLSVCTYTYIQVYEYNTVYEYLIQTPLNAVEIFPTKGEVVR